MWITGESRAVTPSGGHRLQTASIAPACGEEEWEAAGTCADLLRHAALRRLPAKCPVELK